MRTPRLLLATALLGLALSACGDGDDTAAPAAPSPSASVSATPAPSPSPSTEPTRSGPVRLTGDGVDTPERVLAFGTTYEQARPVLDAALGQPTKDTGEGSNAGDYGVCPGDTLRALEYGDGALVVLFGDVAGPELTMYQWALDDRGAPSEVPQASAFVGDAATYEFGIGTTVAQLRDGVGDALQVTVGEVPVPPTFRLTDQSSSFFGTLTGTAPTDTASFVMAGQSCGD